MATVITTYKTYNFKDKDPTIDEIRTIVEDSGMSWQEIEDTSGVSISTLRGWFLGETRRPHSATLEAVGRACGFRRKWVKL